MGANPPGYVSQQRDKVKRPRLKHRFYRDLCRALWRTSLATRRLEATGLELLRRFRGLARRILRMAALPARWQARHMYQLATVR